MSLQQGLPPNLKRQLWLLMRGQKGQGTHGGGVLLTGV